MKTTDKKHLCAIILAAGCGSRMGKSMTKQRMSILGESLLYRSVRAFSECSAVDSIVVVCRADEADWVREEIDCLPKLYAIVIGGKTRAESARIGFFAIPEECDFVAIHDGARCLITPEGITAVADAAFLCGAATASCPMTDTVKLCDGEGDIIKTVPRAQLSLAQTPQIFSRTLYAQALASAESDASVTDDNMLVESLGVKIRTVNTGKENIKITTAEDIPLAEYLLGRRGEMSRIRIGHGYDVHRFGEGRRLVLGGVDIPFEKGLIGHSDADVLVHAIMDALLGAMGLGDIGRHFPDTDDSYKGVSSLELLRRVVELMSEGKFAVENIDATLIIQRPKIMPYIDEMTKNIANILEIDSGRINIKATTEEHLGFTGREEGVASHAVALISKK